MSRIGLLYYGDDLHFRRMRQQAKELGRSRLAAPRPTMEKLERSVWRAVDVVLYPSDEETAIVTDIEPGVTARTILPYCFAEFAAPRPPAAIRSSCSSAASRMGRTRRLCLWFVGHVLPLIREQVPAARLHRRIQPSPDVLALAGDAVSVRANVSEPNCVNSIAPRASPPCRCATGRA